MGKVAFIIALLACASYAHRVFAAEVTSASIPPLEKSQQTNPLGQLALVLAAFSSPTRGSHVGARPVGPFPSQPCAAHSQQIFAIDGRTKLDGGAHGTVDVDDNEGRYNRREVFSKLSSSTIKGVTIAAAAASGSVAPFFPPFIPPSYAATDEFETTIGQTKLLSGLSNAPVRNIIITGANSGVGLAGAKLLTAAGHRVTLACRTQAKADLAAQKCMEYAAAATASDDKFLPANLRRGGGVAIGAECDLSSLSSIRSFAKSVDNLDTLVLNAGLAHGQAETDKVYRTTEGFEETIGVNHLGHFLLASLLAPSLAKSKVAGGGKLVSTASPVHDPTSGGGNVGLPATLGSLAGMKNDGAAFTMVDGGPYDPDKAYKDSKLCNMLFMAEASERYKDKFTVNAFSPGLIAEPNGFFRNQNKVFATIFNTITKVVGVAESNEFGGSALAYMAVDPTLDGKSGGWYDSAPPGKHQLAKHAASTEAQNKQEQQLLWELSSKLVGV